MATSSYSDDVYANPVADRKEQERVAAAQRKAQEAYQKRYNDSVAAVQERQNNNPYYKDPQYNSDDYYDYEYASRYKRFQDPVNGVGYYDNYYTNTYFYSGNPYQYGMSVYNGYNFWPSYNTYNYMPSTYFYSSFGWGSPGFSSGFGYGGGYGYGGYGGYPGYGYGYDPFMAGYYSGYSHGYNNGYWGYPFGYGMGGYGYGYGGYPYGYGGYGYGSYGNPYGWGYYNAYDQNSGYTYAPRTSHGGGSSNRISNPGMNSNDNYYQNFVTKVVDQQARAQKFNDVPAAKAYKRDNYSQQQNGNVSAPVYNNPDFYNNTSPVRAQPGNQNPENGGFKSNVPANQNNNGLYNNGNVNHYNQGGNNTNNNNNNNHAPAYTQPTNNNGQMQQPVYDPPRQAPVRSNENIHYDQQPTRIFEPSPNYNSAPSSFPRGGGGGGGSSPSGGGRPR